jgi:hypothetical protein
MDIDKDAIAYTITGNSNILGNAIASTINNVDVTGDVTADSISNCRIDGAAKFDTRSSCTVGGSATSPNPDPYPAPPALPLPITEDQIDVWEEDAVDGGEIGSQSYVSGSRTLGPVKINGDLSITNTAEVIITGTIWVTGQLIIDNQATFRLDPAYGSLSGLVIVGTDENTADGYVDINNNTNILGSGTPGSYLMLLSQREGVADVAIRNNNIGLAAILYAGEGLIEIGNTAAMKEVTAEKLRISNSSTVTYETGLASAVFGSGPGGGWEIQKGTWQLLQ